MPEVCCFFFSLAHACICSFFQCASGAGFSLVVLVPVSWLVSLIVNEPGVEFCPPNVGTVQSRCSGHSRLVPEEERAICNRIQGKRECCSKRDIRFRERI